MEKRGLKDDFCFYRNIFIVIQFIYNVALVSAVQQSKSVIHIHISTLFQSLFPYRPLQSIEQSFLCHALGPCQLPILCMKDEFYMFGLSLVDKQWYCFWLLKTEKEEYGTSCLFPSSVQRRKRSLLSRLTAFLGPKYLKCFKNCKAISKMALYDWFTFYQKL